MKLSELWEVRIGIMNVVIASISLISSVLIYVHGLDASVEKEHQLIEKRSAVEFDRVLWNQKRESYHALANILGSISAELELHKPVSDDSLHKFYQSYWGALILVENESVREEIVKLKNDLRDLKNGRIGGDKVKRRIQRVISMSREDIDNVL